MKIKNAYLYDMRNGLYFQFHTEFKILVEQITAVVLNISQLFAEYLLLYAKMDEAYKNISKSPQTEQIKEADKARDELWRGIIHYIEACLRHFDPVVREAARQVNIVFESYGKGKVVHMSLNEQTAAITNILQDLDGPYALHVRNMSLGAWLLELKARNITFANFMRDRVHEGSLKVETAMKDARALLDAKFHEIVEQINARIIVEGPAVYEPLVKQLNINIAKFKLLLPASRTGKKHGDNNDVE